MKRSRRHLIHVLEVLVTTTSALLTTAQEVSGKLDTLIAQGTAPPVEVIPAADQANIDATGAELDTMNAKLDAAIVPPAPVATTADVTTTDAAEPMTVAEARSLPPA